MHCLNPHDDEDGVGESMKIMQISTLRLARTIDGDDLRSAHAALLPLLSREASSSRDVSRGA